MLNKKILNKSTDVVFLCGKSGFYKILFCLLVWFAHNDLYWNASGYWCTANLLGALLWEKNSVDVWKNTSRCNGYTSEKLVQFFIILDSKSDVSWYDTALLVVTCCVTCKFQDFSTEVLKYSCEVNWSSSSDTGSVLSLTKVTSDTTYWELKSCLSWRTGGFLLSASSFSFSFAYSVQEWCLVLQCYRLAFHARPWSVNVLVRLYYVPDMLLI